MGKTGNFTASQHATRLAPWPPRPSCWKDSRASSTKRPTAGSRQKHPCEKRLQGKTRRERGRTESWDTSLHRPRFPQGSPGCQASGPSCPDPS